MKKGIYLLITYLILSGMCFSISYKVKKGDCLSKIGDEYNIDIATIKKVNNLKSDNLNIGQNLEIPSNSEKNNFEIQQPIQHYTNEGTSSNTTTLTDTSVSNKNLAIVKKTTGPNHKRDYLWFLLILLLVCVICLKIYFVLIKLVKDLEQVNLGVTNISHEHSIILKKIDTFKTSVMPEILPKEERDELGVFNKVTYARSTETSDPLPKINPEYKTDKNLDIDKNYIPVQMTSDGKLIEDNKFHHLLYLQKKDSIYLCNISTLLGSPDNAKNMSLSLIFNLENQNLEKYCIIEPAIFAKDNTTMGIKESWSLNKKGTLVY